MVTQNEAQLLFLFLNVLRLCWEDLQSPTTKNFIFPKRFNQKEVLQQYNFQGFRNCFSDYLLIIDRDVKHS